MNRSSRILVAEGSRFSEEAASILRCAGELQIADLDRTKLLAEIGNANLLWVRLRHRIDEEVLEAAPQLIALATPTTGLTHIDIEAAERRGVSVLSLKGETEFLKDVRATAEHTIGLILALLRRIPQAYRHARSGGWERDLFLGAELYGKTAGIVGLGRLGSIVAGYLAAFGMRVIAADPRSEAFAASDAVERISFHGLLERADLVTVHADLNESSRGMFGQAAFRRMKSGAVFVNTSRGELVDEAALLRALKAGRLAGAALDVLSDERVEGMGHSALVQYAQKHDNLIITPHIGGATRESMEKTEVFLAKKVARYLGERREKS